MGIFDFELGSAACLALKEAGLQAKQRRYAWATWTRSAQIPLAEANCTKFYAPDPAMDPEYGEVRKTYRSSLSRFWDLLQAFGS